ncbi:efflux RND transporter periplasmic adaptor subunit [Pleionea sp. CnH1-48]|uniref:efflux RND transporter periplasmic adaptor subunit n=1 Tax=Pleionea sp. CnH1-48 TaxID=2954494 RepID=UPI0020978226|nr:efflux RND transporter periplasmic adaptor subunit [Pleionea sp. CnH1-48]MCO7226334.1 efflux RND transporter periplasmic adaptor subunit [Pleionea sp. CnH1-48]
MQTIISDKKKQRTTLLFIALCLSSTLFAQQPVNVEEVTMQVSSPTHRFSGTLRAAATSNLSASDASRLEALYVNEGEKVRKNQIIAKLDDRRLTASYQQQDSSVKNLQAIVAQRQAELNNAQADYDAFVVSQKGNAVSKRELRNTQTQLAAAEAALLAATHQLQAGKSLLQHLKVQLEDTEIKAPYNGIITQQLAFPGEWVQPGDTILTLVSSDQMEAWLEIPERLAHHFMGNSIAPITVDINSQRLTASQAHVISQVAQDSRTFFLIAQLDQSPDTLFSGMSVHGWVELGEKTEHLMVHKDAIIKNHNGTLLYKVIPSTDPESKTIYITQAIPIQELFVNGDYVAVNSHNQLQEGDQIVVEGNRRLMPGAQVQINTPPDQSHISLKSKNKEDIGS